MTVDSASAGTVQCMPVRATDRAQTRSSPASANPLVIFCYQVFFDYVPSSATSLHLGLAPPNPDMAVCGNCGYRPQGKVICETWQLRDGRRGNKVEVSGKGKQRL